MPHVKLILLILCVSACVRDVPKIKVKTTTMSGFPKMIITDSTAVVTSDYFEISLNSYTRGGYYKAERDLQNVTDLKNLENNRRIFIQIVENDSTLRFTTPTEFLNWMSDRGYEMQSQEKLKHSIDYTFRKK